MAFEVSGRLHTVFEAKDITQRFRKREFVLELADNPKYPQLVLFQLTGDRCENLDGFKEGDSVSLEFSLRGREWTSPKGELKYFTSLEVFSISGSDGAADDDRPPLPDEPPPDLDDDLPF